MRSPTTPTMSVASTSGISQSPTVTSPPPKPDVEAPSTPEIFALELERDVPAEQVQRAVRHVDDPHQPEDQREAAGDDEVEPRDREAIESYDDELREIAVRGDAVSECLVGDPHDGDSERQAPDQSSDVVPEAGGAHCRANLPTGPVELNRVNDHRFSSLPIVS